jgi:hypothetical protein
MGRPDDGIAKKGRESFALQLLTAMPHEDVPRFWPRHARSSKTAG